MSRVQGRRRATDRTPTPATPTTASAASSAPPVPVSAADPPRETRATPPPAAARQAVDRPAEPSRLEALAASRWPLLAGLLVVGCGLAALVCAMVPVGPGWLDDAGAVAVASVYSWSLAARTGGRPVVFGTLALGLGLLTVLTDRDELRTGAAVMTCVVAAILAVMATVPARTFLGAARECVVAVLVAAVGSLATIGFEPAITVTRFEYATFGLALAGAFTVVYRLGAGLHGLGRRGVVIVVVGGAVLAVALLYGELLRHYGSPDLVDGLLDVVHWCQDHLGAFPRPIEAVLGIPALAYGVHMRARRRQGWWVCAFGVAATSAVGNALANPRIAYSESGLSVLYGLLIGLVLGFVVIRLDLLLTGGDGGRSRGRRSRVAHEAVASRPEPPRTRPLL